MSPSLSPYLSAVAIQINGKVRGKVEIDKEASEADVVAAAMSMSNVSADDANKYK